MYGIVKSGHVAMTEIHYNFMNTASTGEKFPGSPKCSVDILYRR